MKFTHLIAGLAALSTLECTYAYPNMANSIEEIRARIRTMDRQPLHRRLPAKGGGGGGDNKKAQKAQPATTSGKGGKGVKDAAAVKAPEAAEAADAPDVEAADPNDDGSVPGVLIGDIKDGGKTQVGRSIARILLEQEPGQGSISAYQIPGLPGTAKCKADVCCVWAHISAELTNLFRGPSNRCNKYARAAIRLGFHDAGTWKQGNTFGGADGSIVLAKAEMARPENKGLEAIVKLVADLQRKYGVGMADLIQFAAKHAVVTCPLGPRIRTFVGRKDSARAAPDNLLPSATASADSLIALFEAKTIPPHSLVALLGAHTTSQQFSFDASRAGAPQDGTPGVWDTLFYNQTLGLGPLPRAVLRLPSDVVLAAHPRTKGEWERFSGDEGQSHWNEDYAYSYIRVSLLGVENINELRECTQVLPDEKRVFRSAGELLKYD